MFCESSASCNLPRGFEKRLERGITCGSHCCRDYPHRALPRHLATRYRWLQT
jgi:hypothetical protein